MNTVEGEKYREMWEELEKEFGWWLTGVMRPDNVDLKTIMAAIKQKYFSQSVKKTIIIEVEVEAKNLIVIDWVKSQVSSYISKIKDNDILKVNIKED